MASFLGRNSRRRRVLNEEALSASSAHLTIHPTDTVGGDDPPRYSDRAGVEHHPQVTDFLPRRYRSLGMLAALGVATTAAVAALGWFVTPMTARYVSRAALPGDAGIDGGIAAWVSAVLLLTAAAVCVVIYSLRRHRIDDIRGRYRVWLAAAVACMAMSVQSVAPFATLAAAAAAYHSGWTALRDHAVWWMVGLGVPLAWIGLRAWLDARESRLAATALAAACLLYAAAVTCYLAAWPADDRLAERLATSSAELMGHWMLLLGVVAYGRFVVLDAQGLIPGQRRAKRIAPRASKSTADTPGAAAPALTAEAAPAALRAFRQSRNEAPREPRQTTSWVDGSEPVDDDYGDDEATSHDRKLSKAERKRLRKLKAQRRAA